jgi:hypothetical protein
MKRTMKLIGAAALAMMLAGCAPMSGRAATGTLIGGGLGAGAGALIGGPEGNPAEGALIGGLLGGTAGYLVGNATGGYHYGPPYYYRGFRG